MKQNMVDTIKDNTFLFVIVLSGGIILAIGYAPPYHDMLIALGAAFIIAGAVGIYMMLATRQVAKKLHERFNVQNDILKDIASSQKQNHSEMIEILKKIEQKL